MTRVPATAPLLVRLAGRARAPLAFQLDGRACTGFEGDTVLTAVLALGAQLRQADASGLPRAGFCNMGACQDCWMDSADGARLRACSTPLQAGMQLLTRLTR
jgi:predicted molibdopterin-dependent oxidoreductase YjgC